MKCDGEISIVTQLFRSGVAEIVEFLELLKYLEFVVAVLDGAGANISDGVCRANGR